MKLRHVIASCLLGILIGLPLYHGYTSIWREEIKRKSNSLVDYIIGEWTGVRQNEVRDNDDSLQRSQFPAKVELPRARLGYFPDTVITLAKMVEDQYAVPSGVTLAQWALESAWGTKNLGVSNYFGHTYAATKKYVASPRSVIRRELINVNGINEPGQQMKFTVYNNIAECFDTHGKYLSQSKLYRAAFYTTGAESFARVISLYYAQDPNYSLKLITIIRRYELQ
jgi:flagellum-specific peptidoglycan hydrolase FlgJ